MSLPMNSTTAMRTTLLLVATALAGCESKLSVDLGTEAPADPAVQRVDVALEGIEFRKDGGGIERLTFKDPELVNLLGLRDGNFMRLFTDEQLDDGHYTGVRLLLTEADNIDNLVVRSDGREYELAVAEADFSSVDFTVDKDESSNDSIVLTLDLRQSLPFDDADTTLTPVLRAIRSDDAGGVSGSVTVTCPANSSLAVYLFSGEDQTPDDLDGQLAEPYLTTSVGGAGLNTTGSYAFRFLPEGRYTLATTCRGDDERPGSSEDLAFQNAKNVKVEADETMRLDLP